MKPDNIKQWLASSQRNVPYELDFFTPFKEMALPTRSEIKMRATTDRNHCTASSDKENASTASSSFKDDTSSSASSSTHRYKRRPRHKTREDHYDYKGSKPRVSTKDGRDDKKDKRRPKKQKRKAKRNLADQFVAKNVVSERLTLNKPGGLFYRGKASAPVSRPGVADLSFSERAFLNLNRNTTQGVSNNLATHGRQDELPVGGKRKRQQEQDAKMSEYFRRPLPTHNTRENRKGHGISERQTRHYLTYETPCRQKLQGQDPSSSAFASVELPGPPYLGFGEPGPTASERSFRKTRTHSLSHVSESRVGNFAAAEKEQEVIEATLESEGSRLDRSSTVFTADPRAMHSPTSNFNFAKLQHARLTTTGADPNKVKEQKDTTKAASKQDEILELLRELQQQQKGELRLAAEKSMVLEEAHNEDLSKSHTASEDLDGVLAAISEKLKSLEGTGNQERLLRGLETFLKSTRNTQKAANTGTARGSEVQTEPSGVSHAESGNQEDASRANFQNGPNEPQIESSHSRPCCQGYDDLDHGSTTLERGPLSNGESAGRPETAPQALDHRSMQSPTDRDYHAASDAPDHPEQPVRPSCVETLPAFGIPQPVSQSVSYSQNSRLSQFQAPPWPSIYEQQARHSPKPSAGGSIGLLSPATTTPRRFPASRPFSSGLSHREPLTISPRSAISQMPSILTSSGTSYFQDHSPMFKMQQQSPIQQQPSCMQDYSQYEDAAVESEPHDGFFELGGPPSKNADWCLGTGDEHAGITHGEIFNTHDHTLSFTELRPGLRETGRPPIVEAPSDMASFWRPNVLY